VALARALVHDPGNVVLDEPTNGLDVMAIRNLREMLLTLKAQGRCVLFSSHVMQEVAALCDRAVIIGRGRVLADSTVQEIRARSGTRIARGSLPAGAGRTPKGVADAHAADGLFQGISRQPARSPHVDIRAAVWSPVRSAAVRAHGFA
jgi:ABC-type multidrug transport system ATPase subunit